MSGFYLALEGAEGAGKSSVSERISAEFRGRGVPVTQVREPGGTELGEEVRRLLLHAGDIAPWAEAALFAAGRAQLVDEVVRPALDRGHLVISDRTYYSSLAYQGHARGLGVEQVRALNEAVLGGTIPDLVAVIDVDPERSLGRQLEADRIGGSGLEFQELVAEGYRDLAQAEPDRVLLVDGEADLDTIARAVIALLESRR